MKEIILCSSKGLNYFEGEFHSDGTFKTFKIHPRFLSSILGQFNDLKVVNITESAVNEDPISFSGIEPAGPIFEIRLNLVSPLPLRDFFCSPISRSLQLLNLENSSLHSLPEEISKLAPTLRSLNLSNNQLSYLPCSFSHLSRLVQLDLRYNSFYIFPVCLNSLSMLEELYLDHNSIKEVPDSIVKLSQLKVLTLSNNKLCAVSPPLLKLNNLRRLNLTFNEIANLPSNPITVFALPTEPIQPNHFLISQLPKNLTSESTALPPLKLEARHSTATKNIKLKSKLNLKETVKMKKRTRQYIPQQATALMKEWLHKNSDNPYPSRQLKQQFQTQFNLPRSTINHWFINARRRYLPTKEPTDKLVSLKSIASEPSPSPDSLQEKKQSPSNLNFLLNP